MIDVDGDGSLAFNQEWFLILAEARRHAQLLAPAPEFPLVFRLWGRWHRRVMEQSLQALAERHSVLRTVYSPTGWYSSEQREMLLRMFLRHKVYVPGMYVQRRLGRPEIEIVEREASTDCVNNLVSQVMEEPFESRRPLVRAVVFHVDVDTQVLVLVVSHLICDGWSIRILLRDFVEIYRSVRGGKDADLPAVDVDYDEFARSQHRAHQSGTCRAEETFWRRQWSELDGAAIRHADLPFARSVDASAPPIMSAGSLWLTPSASVVVAQAARCLRITPYILFRTAMTLALVAAIGKRRLAYWANFANRRRGFENTVGWCANTHIVTVDVPETGAVADLCRLVATGFREAQRHESLPLVALWQRVGKCLDPYDTRVNFDVWPIRRAAHSESAPIEIVVSSFLPRMDLDVRLVDDGERFGLRAIYANRYDAAGVATFVSHMAAIAERIAIAPNDSAFACVYAAAGARRSWRPFTTAYAASDSADTSRQ